MRLLDAVLGTTAAARSVDDAAMVLTDVGSGMCGVNAVPGGGPLGVLPVVTVPTVAAGVGVVVAICVVATPAGPLVVKVLTALIRPIKVARSAAARVGVLPRLSGLGPVVVVVPARIALMVAAGAIVARPIVVVVVPAGVAGAVVVVVVPAGVARPIVVVVVPARANRSIVVAVPVGVVAVVPAHVAGPITIFRPAYAQEGQTQVGHRSAASRVHNLKVHKCLVNLPSHFSFPPC